MHAEMLMYTCIGCTDDQRISPLACHDCLHCEAVGGGRACGKF